MYTWIQRGSGEEQQEPVAVAAAELHPRAAQAAPKPEEKKPDAAQPSQHRQENRTETSLVPLQGTHGCSTIKFQQAQHLPGSSFPQPPKKHVPHKSPFRGRYKKPPFTGEAHSASVLTGTSSFSHTFWFHSPSLGAEGVGLEA